MDFSPAAAVILALDPAKGPSGAALLRPNGAKVALAAYAVLRKQSERDSFVAGAVELGKACRLPLVCVAETWDPPRGRDQRWTYPTILGIGEGWGLWAAELERHGVRGVVRVTPNVWRNGLFGKRRPKDSDSLEEMAKLHVLGTFGFRPSDHNVSDAVCIGLWGSLSQEVRATAEKVARASLRASKTTD